MKVYHSIQDFKKENIAPTSLTIGSFDGVHRGHELVLNQLKNVANQSDTKSVVLTFTPHPRIYFNPKTDLRLLQTDTEKIESLSRQDVDFLIIQKFDDAFAKQSPETYIRQLKENLGMQNVLIGYDHRFGKDRAGNFEFVKSLETKYDYKTHQIEVLNVDNINLSSSVIRKALQAGNLEKANEFLGHYYSLSGVVVRGNQLGRTLGYPTANIDVAHPYKLIPKDGVYLVQSTIDGQKLFGMMNIGVRPTIEGKIQVIETHFFDFDKDIYGKNIQISLISRLRDEQKFASLDELKQQLQRDELVAMQLAKLR